MISKAAEIIGILLYSIRYIRSSAAQVVAFQASEQEVWGSIQYQYQ